MEPAALPATLPELLDRAAADAPGRGVEIFDRRGRGSTRRTYPELAAAAEGAAAGLSGLGVRPGDPVVVALPTSWDWLEGWLGALRLGALPCAAPPEALLGAVEEQLDSLTGTLERLGARCLLGSPRLLGQLRERAPLPADLVAISPEGLAAAPRAARPPLPAASDEVAFLQLTSGTTGRPRAVMISHRAALHNTGAISAAISEPLGVTPGRDLEAQVVSWLPLYHDMGLVGSLLTGLRFLLEIRLLPPQAFAGRPRLWLEALSGTVKSVSTAPNFGYHYCVEQVDPATLDGVDLSSWKAALVGAETVRSETVQAFAGRFAGLGFRAEAMRPCYGLAEATLAVTIDRRGEGVRERPLPGGDRSPGGPRSAVSLGEPVAETEVAAFAMGGERLPERRIGEIRVRGPGIFSGYRNDDAATAEALVDGWLRTGDLGFLDGGELFLTGRLKEVLIVRGENLMPHDMERIAEQESGGGGALRAGAIAVEENAAGSEAVALVVEVSSRDPAHLRALADRIRRRIGQSLAIPLADVAFVAAGKIPKTTSGKVRRRRLREIYLAGGLPRIEH